MWEGAKTIYNYVEGNGIYVEDLDIQLRVYVFPMTKDLLAFCKEKSYRFNVLENSGNDEDTIMSYPHYDFTYTDIDSVEWVTNCTEETKFSVGTCASAGFDFSIFSEKYLDDGSIVTYDKIAFKGAVVIPVYDFRYNDILISQKQLGVFHVSDYENEAGMINFTCMDNMRFFDKKAKDIDKFITVPVRSDDLFGQILLKLNLMNGSVPGVKYFQVNKVDHLKKMTYRTIIGYAMEAIGAYAYANDIGEICEKCFNASDTPVVTIPYDDIMEDKSSGAGVRINGYEIQYGSNMVSAFSYGEGEAEVPVPMTVDNPLFIKKKQESLDIIGERLDSRMFGFTFEPYEVTTFLPNFLIEAGDFVNVEDKYGEMHKILVSQLTWRDNLEMEIISACETEGTDGSGSSDYDSDVSEAIQRNGNVDSVASENDSEVPTTVEMAYTGKQFNAAVKYLTTGSEDYATQDTTIETVEVTHTAPASDVETRTLTDTSSKFELKAYIDGTTLKLYTNADKIVLPNDSEHMFYLFSNLKNLIMTSEDYDGSKMETTKYMFLSVGYKGQLEKVVLDIDTSSVTDMSSMFKSIGNCDDSEHLTSLVLGENFNTSNVKTMESMFYGAQIENVKLGNNFNTSQVENMSGMFCNCSASSIDFGGNFSTHNVTNMKDMFNGFGANKIQEFSLPDSFDTSNVTDMSSMFSGFGSNSLTKLEFGESFDTSKVTKMSGMFMECGKNTLYSMDLGARFLPNENLTSLGSIFDYFGVRNSTVKSIIYLQSSFFNFLKNFVKAKKGDDYTESDYYNLIGIYEEQLVPKEY